MASKKSFKMENPLGSNPAMQFISTEAVEAVEGPAPARRSPVKKEAKSKRLQLLITPSLYNQLKQEADKLGLSVNEAVNDAIKVYLSR